MKSFPKFLAPLFLLGAFIEPLRAQVEYKPIPPGFDFPAPQADLLQALDDNNIARLRQHGWMVFAGLTQPARPQDPSSEAVWETWFTIQETFTVGATPQGARTLKKNLTVPRQFGAAKGAAHAQAVGESQRAFVLFNKENHDHIRTNQFYLAATLDTVNKGWTSQTAVADRKIKDFPSAAVSLKTVWMLVKKGGKTPLPIWDEQPRVPNAGPEPPSTWKRVVLVDPSRTTIPTEEKEDTSFLGRPFPSSHVVPLAAFYHFALDAKQATQMGGQAGDFAVLTAMHCTTKEIPNWVWATFWWHDQPSVGPYAQNRPAEMVLKGLWRNYLMDVSYDMERPKETDNTPNAVFNPWLEARFVNGVNSNCMTCHQRALWPLLPGSAPDFSPFLPVTRGTAPPDDPIFKTRTKLDFLWSVGLESN
jgi:hypothetical protein